MNQTIGERIAIVIEDNHLKKVQFAADLKIDQSYVTQLIKGRSNPSERLIDDICFKYNVNADWLKYGKGEKYSEMTRSERIVAFASNVATSDDDDFRKRFISMLERLKPEHWALLAEMAEMVLETQNEEEGKHE